MYKLNTLAKVRQYEICTGYSHEFYFTDGETVIVTDSPRDAILRAPAAIRPLLMKQWLDRLDQVVTPLNDEIAKENLLTENEYKDL